MLTPNNLTKSFTQLSGSLETLPSAWIKVGGPDAADFLQGQCTQDLRSVKPGQFTRGLWLNIKGRVQAESLILRGTDDHFWLWSAHSPGEALAARLLEFVIADDVTVENYGANWTQLTLAGPLAAAWLTEQGTPPPKAGEWCSFQGGFLFQGRPSQTDLWEWLRQTELAEIALPGALGQLSENDLMRARIATGTPAIPAEFGPQDLPQEAGLEQVAISFTKGCYLGQEVMARLHAMGRVRRRLVRIHGQGPVPIAGTGLLDENTGKRSGDLRAAIEDDADGWLGLAVVTLLGAENTKTLFLEGNDHRAAHLIDSI